MTKMLLFLALLSVPAFGQVEATVSAPASAKPGETVTVSATLKNVLTPREPVIVTGSATWEWAGEERTTTVESLPVRITQAVKLKNWRLTLGALFDLRRPISATLNGEPATGTVDGQDVLIWCDLSLAEGESAVLSVAGKVK